MSSLRSQMFPCPPSFTEAHLPSLSSRVYIITGASSGMGYELVKMLYSKSATVYLAARNAALLQTCLESIKGEFPDSMGRLESLVVDLSDLSSVASAAKEFSGKEGRLDGLVLNAGVMLPPEGSTSTQGHELQMATNCLGGYLLMRSLEDLLIEAGKVAEKDSVRIIWLASTLQLGTPKGGIIWDDEKDMPKVAENQMDNYMMSKVGNVFLARETAGRLGKQGIISVAVNPGFLKTNLQRSLPAPASFLMGVVFKGPKYGAYSEFFALSSSDVTAEKNGSFVIPWGRFGTLPEDIERACQDGVAGRFVGWCERETKAFI